jgi:hypothetical protein
MTTHTGTDVDLSTGASDATEVKSQERQVQRTDTKDTPCRSRLFTGHTRHGSLLWHKKSCQSQKQKTGSVTFQEERPSDDPDETSSPVPAAPAEHRRVVWRVGAPAERQRVVWRARQPQLMGTNDTSRGPFAGPIVRAGESGGVLAFPKAGGRVFSLSKNL